MQIFYDKLQGCGNDYILIDETETELWRGDKKALVIKMSNRHFGVGSDGVIFVHQSDRADFEMQMYNADGSRGEMCGNGIRCLAKYVCDRGKTDKDDISVISYNTVYPVHVIRDEAGTVVSSRVQLPCPRPLFVADNTLNGINVIVEGEERRLFCVDVGNPHAVLFVEDVEEVNIDQIGQKIEFHSLFPNRVNVEFVEVTDDEHIRMRVWERGSGETLACGSGSCGAAWVCMRKGLTENCVSVTLKGGELKVNYDLSENVMILEGPAVHVCSGVYEF